MGMYTELSLAVEFKENLPEPVVSALTYMVREDDAVPRPENLPDHPLFQTERWDWMLRSGGSYYFDARPFCRWEYDDIAGAWFLTFCTNIKNYRSEWEHFVDFIAPYLTYESRKFIGHYRYEEDEEPTLLYADGKGGVEWVWPKTPKEEV